MFVNIFYFGVSLYIAVAVASYYQSRRSKVPQEGVGAGQTNNYHLRNDLIVSDSVVTADNDKEQDEIGNDVPTATATMNGYTIQAQQDQVTNLPGLNYDPGFNQFSGYFIVDDEQNRKIHYWYVESMNDPENDPVVFWTNGGPGCSGLLGFGTEFGPFYISQNGTLEPNPFTWNSVASILYVEQPAGVGFSYSDNTDDYMDVGDKKAAVDNYRLIVEFYKRFPERKGNDFYISSESFGGHYIPHLALEILDRNVNNEIPFAGFLVGNPYVDPFSNDITMMTTYYMHGLFPLPTYLLWQESCTDPNDYDEDKCDDLIEMLMEEAGDGINPYALDFPSCTEPDSNDYPPTIRSETTVSIKNDKTDINGAAKYPTSVSSQASRLLNIKKNKRSLSPPFLPTQDKYHPCAESHLFNYLNRNDVKTALHVNTSMDWSMCSDEIMYSEEDSMKPQMVLYEELILRASIEVDLKMMVYSGDDDSVCSTAGTQYWIYDIGAKVKEGCMWNAWSAVNNQTAGYVTEFDLGDQTQSSFVFTTVHGAGHEVPAYRPAEALFMFKSFLNGEWGGN